jgi:hypothetical protein
MILNILIHRSKIIHILNSMTVEKTMAKSSTRTNRQQYFLQKKEIFGSVVIIIF